MTDLAFIAIIGALPATLTAAAGLIVSLKNGRKADAAVVKQEEIHTLVNSNMTAVKNDLADAKNEIAALKDVVAALTTR